MAGLPVASSIRSSRSSPISSRKVFFLMFVAALLFLPSSFLLLAPVMGASVGRTREPNTPESTPDLSLAEGRRLMKKAVSGEPNGFAKFRDYFYVKNFNEPSRDLYELFLEAAHHYLQTQDPYSENYAEIILDLLKVLDPNEIMRSQHSRGHTVWKLVCRTDWSDRIVKLEALLLNGSAFNYDQLVICQRQSKDLKKQGIGAWLEKHILAGAEGMQVLPSLLMDAKVNFLDLIEELKKDGFDIVQTIEKANNLAAIDLYGTHVESKLRSMKAKDPRYQQFLDNYLNRRLPFLSSEAEQLKMVMQLFRVAVTAFVLKPSNIESPGDSAYFEMIQKIVPKFVSVEFVWQYRGYIVSSVDDKIIENNFEEFRRAILSTPSVNRQKFAQVEAFLEQHSEKRADPQGSEAFPWYEKLAIAVLLSFSLIWVALRLSSWFSQEKEPVQREDRARGVDLTRVLRRQVAADPEAKADRPDSTVRRRRKKNTGNDESLPINRPDLAPQTRKNRQRDNTAGSEQKQVQKTDHEIKQELARITVQWEKEKTKVVGLLKEIKEKVRTGTKSDKNKADEFEKSFKNILTDWKPKSNESIQPLIKRRSSKVLPSLERFSNELKSFLNPPVVVPAVLSDSQSRASEASEHEASDVDHRPADSEGSSGSSDSESGSDSDGEADAPIIGEPLSVNTAANPNITPFSMVSSQELLHSSPQAASSSQSSTAFYAAPAAFPLYHGYLDRSDLSYRSELFGDKPDAVKVLNHYDVRFRVIKNLVDTVDSEDLACRAGRNYRTPNLRKARACLVHLSPELDSLTPKELERFSKPFNNQNGVCLFLAYQFCVRSRQLQWQNDFEGLSVDLKEYFRRYSKPEVKAFIGERARRIEAVLDLAPGIADRSQIDNALKLLCAEIGELLSARKDKDLRRVFGEPLVDKLINLRNGTFHDAREMRIVSRDNATGDVDVIVQGDDQGIDVEALCREVLDCTQCFRSDLAQVAAYP